MPSETPIEGLCGAKIANSIEKFGKVMYCEHKKVHGRTRCKYHGGSSPRGVEHPRFRGRGYSLDIPSQLGEKVLRALDDPDLISLGHEIALLDGRIGSIFENMTNLESETAFDVMREAIYDIERAIVEDDIDKAMESIRKGKKAIKAKNAERDGWSEIYGVIKERRQLVDTERKREEMLQGTMTARQMATFIAALQTAILEEVHDEHTRKRLALRLQFLLGLTDAPMKNQHIPGEKKIDFVDIDRGSYVQLLENVEPE